MLPQRNLVKRVCLGLLSLFDRNYFSAREHRKSPARRFTYHSDGMADARLFEMLDSIAIQVSPHSYRPVIELMFYDGVVNDGRLYTLRCVTSVMMIKYLWGKDYIRFEYKKFVKRLTPDRQRHHHLMELFDSSLHRLRQHQHPADFDSSIRQLRQRGHQLHQHRSTTSPTRCQTTVQTRRHRHHSTRCGPTSKKQRERYCHCNETLLHRTFLVVLL